MAEEKELISIIVPVYNVKKYLKKCLDSLLNQTYKNLEIILVNDGSTDGSDRICEEYAEIDSRVVCISQQNLGLSAARNAGMKIAKGQYFAFVDSDDYVHKDFILTLYKCIKKNNASISLCQRLEIDEKQINYDDIADMSQSALSYGINDDEKKDENAINKKIDEYVINDDKNDYIISGKDAFLELYRDDSVDFIVAWNKLYHRKFLDDLKFPQGKIHEDEFAIPMLLYGADKIVYKKLPLYFYIKRQGSIMLDGFSIRHLDLEEALQKRIDFYQKEKLNDCIGKGLHHFIGQSVYDIGRMGKNFSKEKRKLKFTILKYYLKYNKKDPKKKEDFFRIIKGLCL